MIKVRLMFTLVGKSRWFERGLSNELVSRVGNEYRLSEIKGLVSDQFGDRATVVINEQALRNSVSNYPEFFSAGWFVSEDGGRVSELVVVDHGNSMESARRSMMDSVKSIDWNDHSVEV